MYVKTVTTVIKISTVTQVIQSYKIKTDNVLT